MYLVADNRHRDWGRTPGARLAYFCFVFGVTLGSSTFSYAYIQHHHVVWRLLDIPACVLATIRPKHYRGGVNDEFAICVIALLPLDSLDTRMHYLVMLGPKVGKEIAESKFPAPKPGSVLKPCQRCGALGWLSPKGQKLARRRPRLQLICLICAMLAGAELRDPDDFPPLAQSG